MNQPHHNPFRQTSDNDSSHTQRYSNPASINPEQPPVQICIYVTPHMNNHLGGKAIGNENGDILNIENDLWSPCHCEV